MISYLLIYFLSYFSLYKTLPIFQDTIYQNDYWAQGLRHLILLYVTLHLTNFIWRQKFVSQTIIYDRVQLDRQSYLKIYTPFALYEDTKTADETTESRSLNYRL